MAGKRSAGKRRAQVPAKRRSASTTNHATIVRPEGGENFRADTLDAIQRAVESLGEVYSPQQWTMRHSDALRTVATKETPDSPYHTLLISSDCRWMWVNTVEEAEEMSGTLNLASLFRSEVIGIIEDDRRFYSHKGGWHLSPLNAGGWLCRQRTRIVKKAFIVFPDHTFAKVPWSTTIDEATSMVSARNALPTSKLPAHAA